MSKASDEKTEAAIEEILDQFKFELVYAYMKMVGWTYHNSSQTPTIATLKETAQWVLERVPKEKGSCVETGGFEASCDELEEGLTLSLRFIPLETVAYL